MRCFVERHPSSYFMSNKESCLSSMESTVSELLDDTEEYIFSNLSAICTKGHCEHGLALKRLANIVPTVTKSDMAGLACFPGRIRNFNPFLSKDAQNIIVKTNHMVRTMCFRG